MAQTLWLTLVALKRRAAVTHSLADNYREGALNAVIEILQAPHMEIISQCLTSSSWIPEMLCAALTHTDHVPCSPQARSWLLVLELMEEGSMQDLTGCCCSGKLSNSFTVQHHELSQLLHSFYQDQSVLLVIPVKHRKTWISTAYRIINKYCKHDLKRLCK